MRGSHVGSTDHNAHPFQIVDLSAHPEYARRVGEIVSLWSMIELRLSIIFGMLLRAPPWQAWEAFFAINNAKARIDMLRALAATLDERIPEKSELLALLDRVQRAPAARHGYAHRPWIENRLDPEELHVIGVYHRSVAEAVRRLDGFVAKYMGDGVLIYFGYPQAHEDDAERGVRAGLNIIAADPASGTRGTHLRA
jgi:hypothetical protein